MSEPEKPSIEILASSVQLWENARVRVKATAENLETSTRQNDKNDDAHKKALQALKEAEAAVVRYARKI